MIAYMDDTEDVERQRPDFPRLKRMIDEGCIAKSVLTPDGRPSYRLLGAAIKRSSAVIYGIINDGNEPQYETLVALATFFEQPPSRWLEAGGFAPTAMPPRWNKLRPVLQREWRSLTPEQRRQVMRDLARLGNEE